MKMPSKGTPVLVDGYGRGIFAGACDLDSDDGVVLLKFEHKDELREGYGRGIVEVPIDEFKQNRIHPEQLPNGEAPNVSTQKREDALGL